MKHTQPIFWEDRMSQDKPGMKLKEQVRNKVMTPQEAMDKLRSVEPLASQTKTYRWLLKHGAL